MKQPRHLSIDEKRDWLAEIFRDTGGEYSQSDKFKAMIEDTKLAMMLPGMKSWQFCRCLRM